RPLPLPPRTPSHRAYVSQPTSAEEEGFMPYPFLSDEWFDAAKAIREDAGDIGPPGGNDIRLNVTVVEGPMGDTQVHLANGVFDRGHVEDAPTKATVPYDVA